MYTKLTVLAVAALLVLGTGSVVAATADGPTADTPDDALPADYTVETVDPDDLSDGDLDRALKTAWTNEAVRSYFDDGAAVNFEVWVSGLDDSVFVKVAPIERPDETRIVAEVDLDRRTVTSIDEPVRLDASSAITIDGSDFDVDDVNVRDDTDGDRNATRITADRARQVRINGSTIERDGDGTVTFEVEDEPDTTAAQRSLAVR